MIIEQVYKITKVSNGYILKYDTSIPADDPDDLPELVEVTEIYANEINLFKRLEALFGYDNGERGL